MRIKRRFFICISALALFILVWKGVAYWNTKNRKDLLHTSLYVPRNITISTLLPPLPENFYDYLTRPYVYVAHGKQSLVYRSIDNKYVLKIMRWPKTRKKQAALAFSLALAATQLATETGVIGVAYGPTLSSLPSVCILNQRGKIAHIDLNRCLFVIQEYVPLSLKETILLSSWKKDMEEGKAILRAFFKLLSQCREEEIIDLDGALIRNDNIALVQESLYSYRAHCIDVGRFAKASKAAITAHDSNRLRPFSSWLEIAWPELFLVYKEWLGRYEKQEVISPDL